jgi:hypothetical protein
MHEAWTHQLETWHEFYLLVGTAGLTLTGLLFVVILFAGFGFLVDASFAMYGAAVGLILLVITGIRNAWDLVLWTSQQQLKK